MNNSFQDTIYSQRVTKFNRSSISERNVQTHHSGIAHWVTSATIDDKVLLTDSIYLGKLTIQLEEQLTLIYLSTGIEFTTNIINVDQQKDSSSCGLFATSFVYHTALGDDVSEIIFDQQILRKHIESCLILIKFCFPHQRVTRTKIDRIVVIK